MPEQLEVNPVEEAPKSLDEVIASLKGFGLEDFEEILTIPCGKTSVRLRIGNIPTEEERLSHLAVDGLKGFIWMQQIKVEILSRSITWINGVDIRKLKPVERYVTDPTDGQAKDIQVVLRNLLSTWGQEILVVLWKVLMVHSQTIEDRLFEKFPQAAVMTEVERRVMEAALAEVEATTQAVIVDHVNRVVDEAEAETKE